MQKRLVFSSQRPVIAFCRLTQTPYNRAALLYNFEHGALAMARGGAGE